MESRAEKTGGWAGGLGVEPGIGDGAGGADDAGDRDRGRAAELIREEAAHEGGHGPGRGTSGPDRPDDPASEPGRVHRAPQAQMERAAERDAQPRDDRDQDHHGRDRQEEQEDERGRADSADEGQLPRRSRAEPSGEGAEQVGDERGRGERRKAHRLESATTGDGREQGGDERHAHPDAHGRDQVEAEVVRERTLRARWLDGRPEHRVPRTARGLRGELSGSAWVSPSRSQFAPGVRVPRPP